MNEPRFVYTSVCCSAPATKPPCTKARAAVKKKGREKAQEFASLGKWSCTSCGRACTVTRSNRPQKEEKTNG